MMFSMFKELCNHPNKLILEHFHHPQKETLVAITPHSLLPTATSKQPH